MRRTSGGAAARLIDADLELPPLPPLPEDALPSLEETEAILCRRWHLAAQLP